MRGAFFDIVRSFCRAEWMINMKEMPVSYHRILSRLERKEARLLKQKGLSLPMGALEQRIPPSLRSNLEKAFQKAFETMLGPGGTWVVEHTYQKGKTMERFRLWEQPLSPKQAKAELKRMERQGKNAQLLGRLAAGAEGTVLGVLGIGLPDIPVILALLLRSLYQSADRYGFSYDSPEERQYLLLLLQGALTQGEERIRYSREADALGRAIDHGWPVEENVEETVNRTSQCLARELLLVKFIQGLPLVGSVGGLSNLSVSGRVARYGRIKYQKRFLEKKVRGL